MQIYFFFTSILLICFLELFLRKKYNTLINKTTLYSSVFQDDISHKNILSSYNDKNQYQYVPYLLWHHKPNIMKASYYTNNLGFRDNEWDLDKKNMRRIFFLCGSSTWGYPAISNANTITYLLEKEHNKLARNDT